MELLLGLSYIEDFKVKLSKVPALFKAMDIFINLNFEVDNDKAKDSKGSLLLTVLLFLVNMLTDAKGENFEEQKKKYEISDEELKKLEDVVAKSKQV